MTRKQLVETINQTALNVWRDHEMVLQVYESERGHWTIKLNRAQQCSVPTEHVFYVMNAMIATALNFKPVTLKADTEMQALQNAIFEAELYERAGQECPTDTPTQQAYESKKKQRETA